MRKKILSVALCVAVCVITMMSLAACAGMRTAGGERPVAPTVRVAVMADLHVSPGNKNAGQLAMAVDEINAMDLDLVIIDGDLTNEGSDAELVFVKSMLDSVTHPMLLVPGNHENNWSQSATGTFPRLWGSDRSAAVVGDIAVVAINCGPYMKMGDGHIKQEDLHWLRHTLDSLVAPDGQRRVLSINHYPLKDYDLDNYAAYQRLLCDYPVIAHINGHYHRYDNYLAGDIDAFTVRALDVDGTYGYTIVEIDADTMRVSQKIIGTDPQQMYAIPVNVRHEIKADLPRISASDVGGFTIRQVHADSASIFTRAAIDAHNVYFGTSTGLVKAIDKRSGECRWQRQMPGALFSRPVVLASGDIAVPHIGGIDVFGSADGAVVAQYSDSDGPYVADGLCTGDAYIQGGYKRIERRSPVDGAPVWTYDSIGNYCQGAPAVDGDDLVFGAWDTNLRCLDMNTGALKWSWNNGRTNNLLGPGNVVPVITPERVYIVAPDRYMTAIDRTTGTTLWRDNSHRYRESLGYGTDAGEITRVYAKTMDGELVCVDATVPQFSEMWVCDMGLGYEHAPCIVAEVDGYVYAGSRRGVLTVVDAATHKIAAQIRLGSSEINGIDIDPIDGSVWVTLIEGTVNVVVNNN